MPDLNQQPTQNRAALRDGIVELRRYTLKPGRRDDLIAIFDRELIETQEAAGISVIGQFRDLDQPDHFVWFRGFSEMQQRAEALAAFYDGSAWAQHGPSANATMIDSDDVLQLKPAHEGAGFAALAAVRPQQARALLIATHHLDPAVPEAEAGAIAAAIVAAGRAAGGTLIASLISERRANTFRRLPVRAGENVVVSTFWPPDGSEQALERLRGGLERAETASVVSRVAMTRLVPTKRSRLG